MKAFVWFIALAIIAISIFFVVNIFVLSPERSDKNSATSSVVTSTEPAGSKEECAAVQARIDEFGRPGWDGLSASLQAEIEALSKDCIFVGDGRAF